MTGLYLFARIAGTGVAIRTDEVEAVVKLSELSPVPGVPPHVAGLSALRSRVLTIIDAAKLVCGAQWIPQQDDGQDRHAVVCEISGHSYGILVDGVDDIQTIETPPLPLGGRIQPVWKPYARGVLEHAGRPHFLLRISDFLDNCMTAQAA